MAYTKRRDINRNGTKINSTAKIQKPTDAFEARFAKPAIDVESNEVTTYVGKHKSDSKYDLNPNTKIKNQVTGKMPDKSVNHEMVDLLNDLGFYGLYKNTPKSHTAIHGFTFQHQKQRDIKTSTIDAAVKAFANMKDMQDGKYGALYVFDLETFGGVTDDKRLSPAGITEFALQKVNFETGERTSHNILMTNDDTLQRMETLFKEYTKLMSTPAGIHAVREHNDVYVFASRMSLYDPLRGADFELVDGMWVVKKLIATEEAQAGNVDSVRRAYKNFKYMNQKLKDEKLYLDEATGLPRDVKAFIDYTAEMANAVENKKGIIAGHNILHFDRGVADAELERVYRMNKRAAGIASTQEERDRANKALSYIDSVFKKRPNLNFQKGYVLDTYPIIKSSRYENEFATPNMQLETLSKLFYPTLAESGTAHLGIHDTAVNLAMILDPAEDPALNGMPLIEHLLESGLKQYNKKNPAQDITNKQLYKVVNPVMSASYTGKGYASYKRYNTGDIYTSGNFHINTKGEVSYDKYSGNTGFNKNGFYTVANQGFIELDKLNPDQVEALRAAYPDFNTENLYFMSFQAHTKTKYNAGHTVTLFAPTQEEMEAMVSSSLVHVADITKSGYDIVEENRHLLAMGSYDKARKSFVTYDTNTADMVVNAIKMEEKKYMNESVNSTVFTGNRSLKHISGLIRFDEEARRKGLGDQLDAMERDGIKLIDIITQSHGKINDKEYFDKKEFAQLQDIYTRTMGYKDKTTNEYRLDFRTKRKTAAAYETVKEQKEYYKNLIEVTKHNYNIKTDEITYDDGDKMNSFFLSLDKKAKVEALKKINMSDEEIKKKVLHTGDQGTYSYAYFMNRFDFIIGKDFKPVGDTAPHIRNVFSLVENEEDMITFDTSAIGAEGKFINKLYKRYLGDKADNANLKNVDENKKEAVLQFIVDLHKNGDTEELYKDTSFKEHIEKIVEHYADTGKAPEDFDFNVTITKLGYAVKKAKERDMFAGVNNIVNNINVIDPDRGISNILNNIAKDEIKAMGDTVKTTISFSTEDERKNIAKQLVQIFGVDDKVFEDGLKQMNNDTDRDTARLIRKISHSQLESYFNDLLQATGDNGVMLHIDEAQRTAIVEYGGKVQELTYMPKISMIGTSLVYETGGSKINIGLKDEVHQTKNGPRLHITTNIDSNFGREDMFTNLIESKKRNNKTLTLSDFNVYLGMHTKEVYEEARHSGLKTDDFTANKRIRLLASHDLYYDFFRQNGPLSHLADELVPIDDKLFDKIRPHVHRMKDANGQIPPDVEMLLKSDQVNIEKLLLDPDSEYYDEFMAILNKVGPSLKETAYTRGYYQIGDRVIGTWGNKFDNMQRPPVGGAGNVKLMKIDDVTALEDLGVMPGSVIESHSTLGLTYKRKDNMDLTSDFRARQVYMSSPMIQAYIERSRQDVLDHQQDLQNMTLSNLTREEFVNLFKEYSEIAISGTYEQARFGDARVLNELIKNKPVDVQYLSVNKDVMAAFDQDTDQKKYQKLLDLMGKIEVDEDGEYVFRRDRTGTMVFKGEFGIEYEGYGGIKQFFGSKHDVGVVSFSYTIDDHDLTDEYISEIINEHKAEFDELTDQNQMMNKLLQKLERRNIKATYRITNANEASLLKIQDAGVEKGMTLSLKAKLGTLNDDVAAYFTAMRQYDDTGMVNRFMSGMVPHEQAIRALHEDIAEKLDMDVEEFVQKVAEDAGMIKNDFIGLNDFQDLLTLVKDEKVAPSAMMFGKHGPFAGFASVANDNISGHENMGLYTMGNFSEAIMKYKEVSGQSYEDAAAELIADMMDDDNDINFIRYTQGGRFGDTVGAQLSVGPHGTLLTTDIDGEYSMIDDARLEKFLRHVDKKIVAINPDAPRELRLVHENVWAYDKKAGKFTHRKEMVGNFAFMDEGSRVSIIGSTSNIGHGIIADSETVSGVSQEFIDSVKEMNELRAIKREALTEDQKARMSELSMYIGTQKDHAKFVKADEQKMRVLKKPRFSEHTERELEAALKNNFGRDQAITEDRLAFLSRKTGGDIGFDRSTKKVTLSDDIKGHGGYEGFTEQIQKWMYYNPYKGVELTPEMLQTDEYKHLKDVYELAKKTGSVDGVKIEKIDVTTAQQMYDLQGMYSAAKFNAATYDKRNLDKLINEEGFELMSLRDYVSTEGSARAGTIDSVADKRVVVDLGADFADADRYIAIPSGGKTIGDMEVLTSAQGKINQLKTQANILEGLEGGGRYDGLNNQQWLQLTKEEKELVKQDSIMKDALREKYDRVITKIQSVKQDIADAVDAYPEKGKLFTQVSKVEMPVASRRAKIMSVTSTSLTNEALDRMGMGQYKIEADSEAFLNRAKVLMADGTEMSLNEMSKKGMNYDFERVGIDEFINMGFLDESGKAKAEVLKDFGFTNTDELLKHFETYGTADLVIRDPTIDEGSAFMTRKYLDRRFDGTNIKSVSSVSMGKYRGDSDGDSQSAVHATLDGISFSLFERKKQQAMESLSQKGLPISNEAVKQAVVADGLISEDIYSKFNLMSAQMDYDAMYINSIFAESVVDTMVGDVAKNLTIGNVGLNTQFKGAKSETFKNFKVEGKFLQPTGEAVNANAEQVRHVLAEAINLDNIAFADQGLLETAGNIVSGSMSIKDVMGPDKYNIIDTAMSVLEQHENILEPTMFKEMQNALIERVRTQQLLEEGAAKSTKTVIGSVNKSFDALRNISQMAFGNEKSENYNKDYEGVISGLSYWIEQKTVISGKKVAFEVGDTRVVTLENILKDIAGGDAGQVQVDQLSDWLDTYFLEQGTNDTWDRMSALTRSGKGAKYVQNYIESQRDLYGSSLSDSELTVKGRNRYIAQTLVEARVTISQDPNLEHALRSHASLGGKTSTHSKSSIESGPAPNDFMKTQAENIAKKANPDDARNIVDEAAQRRPKMSQNLSDTITRANESLRDSVSSKIGEEALRNAPSLTLGTGLGLLALGTAAGLMVAGYAGGGHSRPTPPQDDTQPVQTAPMLDDEEGAVGMQQQGYIININADTRKGARNIKRTMKEIARASNSGGDISINMNYKTTNGGGYSNKDIENIINNFI